MRLVKNALKTLLDRQGLRLVDKREYFHADAFLHRQLVLRGRFFFVQIGANDGISFDPLYPFVSKYSDGNGNIRGIVVEPMADAYRQLCQTYSRLPGIVPVNAAIHNSEKEMTLYKVDPKKLAQLPEGCKGIASFDPEHHRRSSTPAEFIVTEQVACLSLAELLAQQQVTAFDLLQMDTEGYDAQIMLGIDFEKVQPSIIRFEHGLQFGTMSKSLFTEIVRRLNDHDYQVIIEQEDATAYRPLECW